MYLLAALTVLSIPTLTVQTVCTDETVKKLIADNHVTTDVASVLHGKTFIDMWRREDTAVTLDCATTEFTMNGNALQADLRNVVKTGQLHEYFETWTEVIGQGVMDAQGHIVEDGEDTHHYTEQYNIFYADEYAFGYLSCGFGNGPFKDYVRMTIAIAKDKQQDPTALASLARAKAVMDLFLPVIPVDMVELTRSLCP